MSVVLRACVRGGRGVRKRACVWRAGGGGAGGISERDRCSQLGGGRRKKVSWSGVDGMTSGRAALLFYVSGCSVLNITFNLRAKKKKAHVRLKPT